MKPDKIIIMAENLSALARVKGKLITHGYINVGMPSQKDNMFSQKMESNP